MVQKDKMSYSLVEASLRGLSRRYGECILGIISVAFCRIKLRSDYSPVGQSNGVYVARRAYESACVRSARRITDASGNN